MKTLLIPIVLITFYSVSVAETFTAPEGLQNIPFVEEKHWQDSIKRWMPDEEESLSIVATTDDSYYEGTITAISTGSVITTIPEEQEYIQQLHAIWSRKTYYQETNLSFVGWIVSIIEEEY